MEPNEYAAGAGQKGMERRADQRVRDFCKTFNEIQTGPNPLTPEEVDRLIEKRLATYGVLKAFSKSHRQ